MRRLACLIAITTWAFGCTADVEDVFNNSGGASSGDGGAGAGTPTTGPSMSTTTSSPTTTTMSSTMTTMSSTMTTMSSTMTTTSTMNTTVSTGETVTTTGMAFCGDGNVDPGEDCDGNNLGGHDCTEFGYVNPFGAFCTAGCEIDFSFCEPECGNNVQEPDEGCDDGNTFDGDGCDAFCFPEAVECANPIPISLGLGTTMVSGTTTGADAMQPQMSNGCGNGTGPEIVYEITPTAFGILTAWLPTATTTYDSMLYFRSICDEQASQTLCSDNIQDGGELVSMRIVPNVPVYLVVDGWGGQSGSFDLMLDLSTGEDCNDPVPILLEGGVDIRAIGSTTDYASNAQCIDSSGFGPDVVYEVTVSGGNYTFQNNAGYNSVMNARATCGDVVSQLACNNPGMTQNSQVTLNGLGAGSTTYLWIDGTMGEDGTYALTINQP
ncbi:MAG: hypothetical protein HOV80_20630 [Polyangiaceae bacterium]|nr:hypothetical protein [Polyangiaceae bacterium]